MQADFALRKLGLEGICEVSDIATEVTLIGAADRGGNNSRAIDPL